MDRFSRSGKRCPIVASIDSPFVVYISILYNILFLNLSASGLKVAPKELQAHSAEFFRVLPVPTCSAHVELEISDVPRGSIRRSAFQHVSTVTGGGGSRGLGSGALHSSAAVDFC